MYPADPSLGSIRCHSCIADSNIPRKCTRDEFQGVFIKCPVDNSPVNTCYKSVHRVTGGEAGFIIQTRSLFADLHKDMRKTKPLYFTSLDRVFH